MTAGTEAAATPAAAGVAKTGLVKRTNGRGHWYTLDGVKVDGVTTLIGKGIPKPALVGWAAKTVAEYVADNPAEVEELRDGPRDRMVAELKGTPYAQRDAAGARGTKVHVLAERLAAGEEVDVPDDIAGYVDGAIRWFEDWRPQIILAETVVASRHWQYAGTLDLVVRMPDGTVWIVDWKTAKSGIWGEVALQLAAYANAQFHLDADGNERPMAQYRITRGMAVHLRPDGTYAAHEVEVGAAAFDLFNRAAWMARNTKDMKARLVSEPLPTPAWTGEDDYS